MKLSEYLKRHKEAVDDFAARAGVSRSTVNRVRQSGRADSTVVVAKIAEATEWKVTARDLLPPECFKPRAA